MDLFYIRQLHAGTRRAKLLSPYPVLVCFLADDLLVHCARSLLLWKLHCHVHRDSVRSRVLGLTRFMCAIGLDIMSVCKYVNVKKTQSGVGCVCKPN